MKTYRNDLLASVHETMDVLYVQGMINKQTMREFDEDCLVPLEEMTPDKIRTLREEESVSQAVFALYLNVSKNMVSDWERGVKKPGGPALRLLALIKNKGLQVLVQQ